MIIHSTPFRIIAFALFIAALQASCIQEEKVKPEEVKQIAKEAYIYGFPMVMNCKTVFDYVINTHSADYKGPFNQGACMARVFTPEDKTIVTPNSDTPYCFKWLDLRSEPVVVSVPRMQADRYYSIQLIDWYTHNYAYIGTRTNSNQAGAYLLAGPDWVGQKPDGIEEVIKSETNLVLAIYRTQLLDEADIEDVKEIQKEYKIKTLSSYIGAEAPAEAPEIHFPEWVEGSELTTAAFEYLDFALDQVETHPDEIELMEKFAKIGLGTPEKFSLKDQDSTFLQALAEGIHEAHEEMKAITIKTAKDPLAGTKCFGTREYLKTTPGYFNLPNFYLQRAIVAQIGIYGNSGEEAVYFSYLFNEGNEPYNASENRYAMRFEDGKLPPVNAFWSLSMYDGPTQLFIHNPLNRYLLNSSMEKNFIKEEDGSVVLYIQKDSPGKAKEANWLPAPDGPFYLILRMYLPKEELLAGKWLKPELQLVNQ